MGGEQGKDLRKQFRLTTHNSGLQSFEGYTVIAPAKDGQHLIFRTASSDPEAPIDRGFELISSDAFNGTPAQNMISFSDLTPEGIDAYQRRAVQNAFIMLPNSQKILEEFSDNVSEVDITEAQRILDGKFDAETARVLLRESDLLLEMERFFIDVNNTADGGGLDLGDPEHQATIVNVETVRAQLIIASGLSGYANDLKSQLLSVKIEEFGVSEVDAERARNIFETAGFDNSALAPLQGLGQKP